MKTFVSILRGINVSGQNKIKMQELADLYVKLGFSGVQTYIQSGNVVFKSDDQEYPSGIEKKIESAIRERFHCEVPVILRTPDELKGMINANPFIDQNGFIPDKIYVTFLQEFPLSTDIEKISSFDYLPDKFSLHGREVYLNCAGGYGTTKLSNNFFEKKLRVKATTRNWNTINKLLELAEQV